ncbi:MAG: DUF5615 family PIN-like protein [Magnetococcales bacterium]|nr:DUF5615 family PIN-like protein [Magnetococcales bacterium]
MKLLFDQNLSPRLVSSLADLYPESAHVREFGMEAAPDNIVLDFAKKYNYILVSKDSDFFDPQILQKHPVKVVWIRRGNCSTEMIADIINRHIKDITRLETTENLYLLILY